MVREPRRDPVPFGGAFGRRRRHIRHRHDLYALEGAQAAEGLSGNLPSADQCGSHELSRVPAPRLLPREVRIVVSGPQGLDHDAPRVYVAVASREKPLREEGTRLAMISLKKSSRLNAAALQE